MGVCVVKGHSWPTENKIKQRRKEEKERKKKEGSLPKEQLKAQK